LSQKRSKQTDIIGIVSFGFFLLLVGAIFATTPNLLSKISDFIRDFKPQEVAPNWQLPAPEHPLDHRVLYTAIYQFCLIFAIFQVFVLGARFMLRDSIDRKAGTISSLVFWFGASQIVSWLLNKTIDSWFVFVGWLIVLVGISIVIKNAIILATPLSRET